MTTEVAVMAFHFDGMTPFETWVVLLLCVAVGAFVGSR